MGHAGCFFQVRLTANVPVEPEGRSDAYARGRVMRVPRLEQFSLSTERLGPATYAGLLKGRDLELVEKAGWDSADGLPLESIPTPVPGEPARQILRVALAWPAPSPHAPLYIWLRSEAEGRKPAVAAVAKDAASILFCKMTSPVLPARPFSALLTTFSRRGAAPLRSGETCLVLPLRPLLPIDYAVTTNQFADGHGQQHPAAPAAASTPATAPGPGIQPLHGAFRNRAFRCQVATRSSGSSGAYR